MKIYPVIYTDKNGALKGHLINNYSEDNLVEWLADRKRNETNLDEFIRKNKK